MKKALTKKATASAAADIDPRFENGPLGVVDVGTDGEVSPYCVGDLVPDVPARRSPSWST
ncbi:hypothetical protein [Streptomyces sp. NPDC002526]